MPELDYALLCDYVRAEGGIAHMIGAGLDTIMAPQVPTGQNLGVVLRVAFARAECGRPHRIEIIFQGEDGERHAVVNAVVEPKWAADLPASWKQGLLAGINMGVPLPRYGLYSFEVLVNDSLLKSVPLRVREAPVPQSLPMRSRSPYARTG
jgi:hypothetical protein